jgi:hypothetical protein
MPALSGKHGVVNNAPCGITMIPPPAALSIHYYARTAFKCA